jgi:hypothetical protein
MPSDRAIESFAQSFRYIVAGISGAGVSTLSNASVSPTNPWTWLFTLLVVIGLLGFGVIVEYYTRGVTSHTD